MSFYLTKEQIALYDQDIYKYLIHLLKVFPSDVFNITQFLLLQFYPLVIRICGRYKGKINSAQDWTDLLAFARHSFVELVLRFDLTSTLYFKTYIPLALDRSLNDCRIYDLRRKDLFGAVRLDNLSQFEKDQIMRSHTDIVNLDNNESEYTKGDLNDYKIECIHFVERNSEIPVNDKEIFLEHFLRNADLIEIAKEKDLTLEVVRRKLATVLEEVKQHLKNNFL